MCRAERIVKPEAVQQELDVYNELLPDAGELAATLLVEITDVDRMKRRARQAPRPHVRNAPLARARGPAASSRDSSSGQSREDRIAAVQYVRFPVGDDGAARAALESGPLPVVLHIAHPHVRASALLPPETRSELARDLAPDAENARAH